MNEHPAQPSPQFTAILDVAADEGTVVGRLQPGVRPKKPRLNDVPSKRSTVLLPAPSSAAVGPAHLVRQHGQHQPLVAGSHSRPADPQVGPQAVGSLRAVAPAGLHESWPTATHQPRSAAAPFVAAAVYRAAQPAGPAQPRSGADRTPLLPGAAPPPRGTLASLAKKGRLAAQRDSGARADLTPHLHAADMAASTSVAAKGAPPRQAAQQQVTSQLAGADRSAAGHSSASGMTGDAQDGAAKKGPVTPFLQRLKAELPPDTHKAVTAHLAAYK